MRTPEYSTRFKKDLKLLQKRKVDMEPLKKVIALLCEEMPLPEKNRDHFLTGNWAGHRECHVAPDWLLVYRMGNGLIVFERTGTHSDLF